MNHRISSNRAFWWKLSLLVLAVLLNIALASRIIWGSHSLYTWRVLKEKQSELSEELAALDEKRAALSREDLAGRFASASPAAGALNSLYECVQGRQPLSAEADPDGFASRMASLGYRWDEASARYLDPDGRPAQVSILACGSSADRVYSARLVQQQWEENGIETTLTLADDFGAYLQMVQDRQFELYIGEMKLYNNNDLSPFWTGSAHYGLAVTQQLLDAYSLMRADSAAAPDFERVFAEQMPYIPLLWRGGVTVSNRRTSGVISSVSDLYYSLASLSIAQ